MALQFATRGASGYTDDTSRPVALQFATRGASGYNVAPKGPPSSSYIVTTPQAPPSPSSSSQLAKDRAIVERLWKAMGGPISLRYVNKNLQKLGGITEAGGRVVSVAWEHRGLTGTIPASFVELTGLTSLILSNNQLYGPLPPALPPGLRTLSLAHNTGLEGIVPASYAALTGESE